MELTDCWRSNNKADAIFIYSYIYSSKYIGINNVEIIFLRNITTKYYCIYVIFKFLEYFYYVECVKTFFYYNNKYRIEI